MTQLRAWSGTSRNGRSENSNNSNRAKGKGSNKKRRKKYLRWVGNGVCSIKKKRLKATRVIMMIVIIEHQCLRSVDSCLEQAHCLWILKFFNPILDKFFTSPILSIQQTLDFLSLLGSTLRGKTPGTRRLER